jgi:hypothetical protein
MASMAMAMMQDDVPVVADRFGVSQKAVLMMRLRFERRTGYRLPRHTHRRVRPTFRQLGPPHC